MKKTVLLACILAVGALSCKRELETPKVKNPLTVYFQVTVNNSNGIANTKPIVTKFE